MSVRERRIYLISKDKTPRIYTLPLPAITAGDQTGKARVARNAARYSGQFAKLEATDADAWRERKFAASLLLTPTGLDFSAGDGMAVVLSLIHI